MVQAQPKLAAALCAAVVGLLSVVGLSSLLARREYRNAQALREEKSATDKKALRTVQQQHADAQARLYVFNMREVQRLLGRTEGGRVLGEARQIRARIAIGESARIRVVLLAEASRGCARLTGFTELVLGIGIDARREEVLAVQADGRVPAHRLAGGEARDLFRLDAGREVTSAAFDGALDSSRTGPFRGAHSNLGRDNPSAAQNN